MTSFLAIIPVRQDPDAGRDCLVDLRGKPLLAHTVLAARQDGLGRIVVSTSDAHAAACAAGLGAAVVQRPRRLDGPDIPVEDVMLHCLSDEALSERPDYVVLLPPELPLRRHGRIAAACETVARERADSLFSCCREAPLLWRRSPGGLVPFYDPERRPPRRMLPNDQIWHRENGSIYLSRTDGLSRHRNRLFGQISLLEMEPEESVYAVGAAGLAVCSALLPQVRPSECQQGHTDATQA